MKQTLLPAPVQLNEVLDAILYTQGPDRTHACSDRIHACIPRDQIEFMPVMYFQAQQAWKHMTQFQPGWLLSQRQYHHPGYLTGQGFYLLKSVCNGWRRCLLLQTHRHQHKATWIMKNQANMAPPKKTNKALVTNPKKWRSTNSLANNSK